MKVLRSVGELKDAMKKHREAGHTIGLVPTMGALHAGHLSLMRRARNDNDVVVASVFVNPTQFNNATDLATYPRTEQADCEALESCNVDYAFIPSVEEIYPEPDTRQFDLGPVSEVMEGAMRPGHFNGVAQIVSKLFALANPTRAYFGEKDFQQIAVVRKMAELENFDIDIVACPIVRETDGLAMSSRNVRLTAEQRKVAPAIHRVLQESVEMAKTNSVGEVKQWVIDQLNAEPFMEVEYYEVVNPLTMQPTDQWETPEGAAVGCITVYCGDVRLIDNITYNKK
ncbi:MAG: pantoate--beta-alanine ligase [Firmicutes bacterium]|nr:pantoate--beta-alanine ligase [Bacillota bacterium]MCM1400429.1 pantoate--beta-alanine ligase [Bacteroides sp.]MCM1476931.1 pantoate--beta-alanine ligase [Bacteroides sp.]